MGSELELTPRDTVSYRCTAIRTNCQPCQPGSEVAWLEGYQPGCVICIHKMNTDNTSWLVTLVIKNKCFTVKGSWHEAHWRALSRFSRCEWVRKVCPIFRRVSTTLSLQLPPGEGSFSDKLFSFVFHSSYHCAFVYEQIFCFRSVKGMYELDILSAIASLGSRVCKFITSNFHMTRDPRQNNVAVSFFRFGICHEKVQKFRMV